MRADIYKVDIQLEWSSCKVTNVMVLIACNCQEFQALNRKHFNPDLRLFNILLAFVSQ